MTFEIEQINMKNASDLVYTALYENQIILRAERLPDEPAPTQEEWLAQYQNLPSFILLYSWIVWSEDKTAVIAQSDISFMDTDENKHLGQMSISVLPEYRRQGIGRLLFSGIVEKAKELSRHVLIGNTSGNVPAGEAFMIHIGAKKALEAHTNQLVLADVDPDLIQNWITRGKQSATDFEFGFWEGAYPEEDLTGIASLNEVMNSQPLGDLEMEDIRWTPEQVRQIEQMMFASGQQRWTYYARHKESGEFAGYTEIHWNPNRPRILEQGNTAVFPHFRGKGLGRVLKASMIEKIMAKQPEATCIRTGNADSNAPMLKINHELGFKPHESEAVWQLKLEA